MLRISPWDVGARKEEARDEPRKREERTGERARSTNRTGGPVPYVGVRSFVARKVPLTRGYHASKNPRRRAVYQRSANRNLLVDHAEIGDLQLWSRLRNLCGSLYARRGERERGGGEGSLIQFYHSCMRAHCVNAPVRSIRFLRNIDRTERKKGKRKGTSYRGHACKRLNGNDRRADRDRAPV